MWSCYQNNIAVLLNVEWCLFTILQSWNKGTAYYLGFISSARITYRVLIERTMKNFPPTPKTDLQMNDPYQYKCLNLDNFDTVRVYIYRGGG